MGDLEKWLSHVSGRAADWYSGGSIEGRRGLFSSRSSKWFGLLGWLVLVSSLSPCLTGQGLTGRPERIASLTQAGQWEQRAIELEQLLRESPRLALAVAMDPGTASRARRLNPLAARWIEEWGEWDGTAEVTVEEDLLQGHGRTVVRVRTDDGEWDVYATGQGIGARCGDRLRVTGIRVAGAMGGTVTTLERAKEAGGCQTTGEQKTAVLLLSYPSQSLPANVTVSSVQSLFNGSSQSVDAYYREASYGKTSVKADVYGPFPLSQAYTCSQSSAIRTAAIAAAESTVNFKNYTRIVLVLPGDCGALGTIGCYTYQSAVRGSFTASFSWVWGNFTASTGLFLCGAVHELGHNLGLMHAGSLSYGSAPLGALGDKGTYSEYRDDFSLMGHCYNFNGTYLTGHFAGDHKSQLGWFQAGNVQQVEASGVYTVLPYETTTTGTQVLRIRRGTAPDKWLWLEYRQPTGFDASFSASGYSSQVTSGALLHYENPADTEWAGHSQLLNYTAAANPGSFRFPALTPGVSWTDPYSNLSLSVTGASASGLNVSVGYGAPCASLNPESATAPAGGGAGSVSISGATGCTWSAVANNSWITLTGATSGTGNGTLSYSVAANPNPVSRVGTITVGQQNFTLSQASANSPPVPSAITPGSGSAAAGTVQFFDVVFTDLDGASTVQSARLLFSTSGETSNACYIEYVPATNQLRLYNDAPASWFYAQPGTNTVLSSGNNQCEVQAGSSSATVSGSTLTLRLAIRFKSSFVGAKLVTAAVSDTAGADSGWVTLGQWTVGGVVNQIPAAGGVLPTNGATVSQTFQFTFSDSNGAADLNVLNVLINNALDGRQACYLAYVRGQNLLYLVSDAGGGLLTAITPGGAGSVANSQCSVNASGTSVAVDGNTLTLTVPLTFSSAFGGSKVIYLAARDVAEANSGWTPAGVWRVPGAAATSPAVVTAGLPKLTAASATVALTFSDAQGGADLNVINLLINSALDGRNACYVAYVRSQNVLYLVNDAGGSLLPGVVLGTNSSTSNRQCTIQANGSSASVSGNQLTLSLAVTVHSPAFTGNRILYAAARDAQENNSGWQAVGTWVVP
jgi:M6 family metalloprotease-like protein